MSFESKNHQLFFEDIHYANIYSPNLVPLKFRFSKLAALQTSPQVYQT